MKKITVIGFGSWGIALACLLDKNGHTVTAWDNNRDYVNEIAKTRRNNYLPDVVIPSSIAITSDVKTAGEGAEIFVLAYSARKTQSPVTIKHMMITGLPHWAGRI